MDIILSKTSSTFTTDLIQLNNLADQGFDSWIIEPGMGFHDQHKWWGNQNARPSPHEGVDIHKYIARDGKTCKLASGTAIPPVMPGRIIKIINDFIAKTVIIVHDQNDSAGRFLHTFYAHIDPDKKISAGNKLSSGTIIGHVTDPKGVSQCPAHLHLSAAWIDAGVIAKALGWENFVSQPNIVFFDPFPLISP